MVKRFASALLALLAALSTVRVDAARAAAADLQQAYWVRVLSRMPALHPKRTTDPMSVGGFVFRDGFVSADTPVVGSAIGNRHVYVVTLTGGGNSGNTAAIVFAGHDAPQYLGTIVPPTVRGNITEQLHVSFANGMLREDYYVYPFTGPHSASHPAKPVFWRVGAHGILPIGRRDPARRLPANRKVRGFFIDRTSHQASSNIVERRPSGICGS